MKRDAKQLWIRGSEIRVAFTLSGRSLDRPALRTRRLGMTF
jgi:hypothetical protein